MDRSHPLETGRQSSQDSRLRRVGVDNMRSKRPNCGPQCSQRSKIRDRRHRPLQGRYGKPCQVVNRRRLGVETVPGPPSEGYGKRSPVDVPGGVKHNPLRTTKLEPGDRQQKPNRVCVSSPRGITHRHRGGVQHSSRRGRRLPSPSISTRPNARRASPRVFGGRFGAGPPPLSGGGRKPHRPGRGR